MDTQVIINWLVQQAPVVVVMGVGIYALWTDRNKERDYSKAQDKLMVDVLNQMSNLLSKISESERDAVDTIDSVKSLVAETKTLVDIRTSELITLLRK